MHLFVYGTLRRSAAHPMHEVLRANASLVGPARARGVLYRVGCYPGMVLDDMAGWVTGELYYLHNVEVLASLDDYEGAGPDDPEPREFRRIEALVEPSGADPRRAWLYVYGWSTKGLAVIGSGDYLADEIEVPDEP